MNEITKGREQTGHEKHRWRTPPEVFEPLDDIFEFGLDAAADDVTHRLPHYINAAADCLVTPWSGGHSGPVWINPPWGAKGRPEGFPGTAAFVERAGQQATEQNRLVVCLVPASTDARWWEAAFRRSSLTVLMPRVAFLDLTGTPMKSPPGAPCLFFFEPETRHTGGRPAVAYWHPGTDLPSDVGNLSLRWRP